MNRATFLAMIKANPNDEGVRLVYADWLENEGDGREALRQRREARDMQERVCGRWYYSGDGNLEYGGVFIDVSTWNDGYCDAVRVTDLDSGCGFTGAVLIEHITILVPNPSSSSMYWADHDRGRMMSALRGCGPDNCRGMSKTTARCVIAEAMMGNGRYDPDDQWDGYRSSYSETVQCEADGPMAFDGWKAAKRLHNTSLEEYVKSVHLK